MLRFYLKILFLILAFHGTCLAQIAAEAEPSLKDPKVGSLVAAAMETAGAAFQSDFLDFISGKGGYGDSGPLIAGLLYLIAIVTAIITLAAGGNYRWGRYLLVGPPLFFFLTQVRIASDGTDWVFGDQQFPKDVKEKMLRGVKNFEAGDQGGADVALFFQFWNVFMSDVTQTLVTQLKRSNNQRHLNFIDKIDRYMKQWNYSKVEDNDLRMLIHTLMLPKCSEFFGLKKSLANPHTPAAKRALLQTRLDVLDKNVVEVFTDPGDAESNETWKRWLEQGMVKDGKATCQDLWTGVVGYMRKLITGTIQTELQSKLSPGQNPNEIVKLFLAKIGTTTNKVTGQVHFEDDAQLDAAMLKAVDWIVARSLFLEIWADNPFANTFEFEGKETTRGSGMGGGILSASQQPDATDEIQQFHTTDVYQHRGDFMAAALAMPHYQGVMLFLLGAAYPFFALMVIVPGRAGAMLTWMSLWAWVKLWDLGFAVVMLIDDILYAMFPRGPNLIENDIMNPGTAWHRILEVDPNYSSAMYYNLLATCLFAVPVAAGVFVKGGAKELTNLMHSSWQHQANALGNSAGTFVRALQAQTYGDQFQLNVHQAAAQAGAAAKHSGEAKAITAAIHHLQELRAAGNTEAAKTLMRKLMGDQAAVAALATKGFDLAVTEEIDSLRRWHDNLIKAAGQKAAYEWANSAQGFWLSERAVAARYSNHHFNYAHNMDSLLDLESSRGNLSDIGFDKGHGAGSAENPMVAGGAKDWGDVKARYDQIQEQLASEDLTGDQREELETEAADIKTTADTATSNASSAQFFNQNKVMSGFGTASVKSMIKGWSPTGGPSK